MLVDVFEDFLNICPKINEIEPVCFLPVLGIAWQVDFKVKFKVKLDLLTDPDMLLMVEKGIRGRICHIIHRHANANNKYKKNCYKNKKSPFLKY